MANYTVNSCKRIVLGGSSPTDIKEVWYCDNYGISHLIWPCRAELTDVYFVDLTTGTSYEYSYSAQNPSPKLIPHHDYAIKGTIKVYEATGQLEATLTDCYFFHETLSVPSWDNDPSSLNWSTGDNSSAGYPDVYPKQDGQSMSTAHGYNVYTIDDDSIGNVCSYSVQLGFYDTDSYGFYTQNGFVFDSNYTTPIVLKRISLSESCAIFDSNNNQISASSVSIGANDSITLTPKTRVTGTGYTGNWETHTNWTVDNTTNWCTITNNQDGSYTFTSNGSTPNTVNIPFTSPNGTILSLYFTYTGMIYRAFIGSDLNSSSMTLSETKSVTVEQTSAVDPQESDWSSYSGEFTITTSDSSVVSVNNTNHTITPVSDGTSTIEVTVGTTVLRSVVVTVSFSNRTIYGKITKDAGSTYETIGNQSYFSLGNGTDFEYNISTTTGNPICFEFYNSSVNGGQDPINNIAYTDVSKPSNTEIGNWNSNGFNIVPTSTTSGNYDITVKVGSTSIGRIYGTFSATSS